jgi:hypothetical protein
LNQNPICEPSVEKYLQTWGTYQPIFIYRSTINIAIWFVNVTSLGYCATNVFTLLEVKACGVLKWPTYEYWNRRKWLCYKGLVKTIYFHCTCSQDTQNVNLLLHWLWTNDIEI